MPADVHQVFNLLERAVLLPVLDDARRHRRADARQLLEIGDVAVLRLIGAGAGADAGGGRRGRVGDCGL